MESAKMIMDPLGNAVLFPGDLYLSTLDTIDPQLTMDPPTLVIERPALFLRSKSGGKENFYYRSIGWHDTLLISTIQMQDRWVVQSAIKNPTREQISDLYARAEWVH